MTFHMVKRAFFKLGLTFFALIIAFLTPESGFPSSGKSDLVFSNKPTKEFHKTISQVSSDNSKIVNFLKSYQVIFVRGIFTDLYGGLSERIKALGGPIPEGFGNPFYHEIKWLKSQGINTIKARINTEESPSFNGDIVAELVEESNRPVILISHSKGGNDTLFGLLQNPRIYPKIAGWLTLQAPLYGSPLFDCLVGCPFTDLGLGLGIDLVGGNFEGLQEMKTHLLTKLHKERAHDIKKITQEIPTVSLASQFKNPNIFLTALTPPKNKSAFEALNRFILIAGGGPNDGMTPIKSACLKGSDCVFLKDLDHGNLSVNLSPFRAYKKEFRRNTILSLLEMLKKRILLKN
ncbi:MAG: hypothetical protein CME68_07895 [Halobacteriovoraceae bacterium]|nr:hypothetical protein [Halobacteriovoraceae bacterium]